MSELHDLLVAEAERLQPTSTPSFETLAARSRHRRVSRSIAVVATAAAVVAGTALLVGAVVRSDDGRAVLLPAGPVVTRGECAGLSVTATLVGHPQRWPIRAGGQPTPISMPPEALMYLRAKGPCVQRLRISASNALIQTATGRDTRFNAQGIGVVVSHGNPGEAAIHLFLVCATDKSCPANAIATIPVTITRQSTGRTMSASASPTP